MPLSDDLRLRAADATDLPRIADLRHAVGWPVHEWALRAVLDPPHARCIVAVDAADRVVGVGSGISYRSFGFVGNMVVDPAHRRRGVGSAILTEVTDFLEGCGCARLELFATDQGRPLYASHGFESTGQGTSAVVPRDARFDGAAVPLHEATPASVDEVHAFDTPRFGGDRRPLIEGMLADPERPVIVARDDGALVGWAWIRPDGGRVGPLLAETPDVAMALVGEAVRRIPGTDGLRLNLPAENRAGCERLRALGATIEPSSGRMARGPEIPRREDTIYANAVGALG